MRTQREKERNKLRMADQVMRLSRLGSFHQSRLSFMRILLRRLHDEKWAFSEPLWDIDENGVGTAVLTATGPQRAYSLVAFAHDLPDDQRSDRVIATAWDATFTLFDGIPTKSDIERLSRNVPLQEAGRISRSELSLSRANRSARLWNHVVEKLADGEQPDLATIEQVGYLMRTTAVYGSGKFGAADRDMIADRPEFAAPFQVEMLSVYLTRSFVVRLVEHMARAKGGAKAATLTPDVRRMMGIGNSTGLGMAPFLVNHPSLLHAWINARESALARVRALPNTDEATRQAFRTLLARACINAESWTTEHPLYVQRLDELRKDLRHMIKHVSQGALDTDYPWDRLVEWGDEALSVEGQEQLVSLVLEPHGHLIDDLASTMACDETQYFRLDGSVTIADMKSAIEAHHKWVLQVNHKQHDAHARFWYVSEAKLEPRLGERHEEPGCELEQPLGVSRDVELLYEALSSQEQSAPLAAFLLEHPQHRNSARRVQMLQKLPYAEIRDNLLDAKMLPIDMLRCKLSFFGATKFDPRSDRWVRICMYQYAPFPDELCNGADDWAYPQIDGLSND